MVLHSLKDATEDELAGPSAQPLFRLRRARKTYGVRRIPEGLFRECRLPEELRPQGNGWRLACGGHPKCRQSCPRCWSLSVDALEIRRGRTTAVLGHSGSGKTTLLYALALLHPLDSDTEMFELTPQKDRHFRFQTGRWLGPQGLVGADALRLRHFGFVFQSGYLSSHMTALQNVGLGPGLAGHPSRAIRQRALELLRRIDFPEDRFDALPKHLSGGEYQRVAVARALAADPDVLFADEPTGNLDPVTGRAVMQSLGDWKQEAPERSLILVTHNLDHAIEFADEIFVLNGGRIVLQGQTDVLERSSIEKALHRQTAPRALSA